MSVYLYFFNFQNRASSVQDHCGCGNGRGRTPIRLDCVSDIQGEKLTGTLSLNQSHEQKYGNK